MKLLTTPVNTKNHQYLQIGSTQIPVQSPNLEQCCYRKYSDGHVAILHDKQTKFDNGFIMSLSFDEQNCQQVYMKDNDKKRVTILYSERDSKSNIHILIAVRWNKQISFKLKYSNNDIKVKTFSRDGKVGCVRLNHCGNNLGLQLQKAIRIKEHINDLGWIRLSIVKKKVDKPSIFSNNQIERIRQEIENPKLMQKRVEREQEEDNIINACKRMFVEQSHDFDAEFEVYSAKMEK